MNFFHNFFRKVKYIHFRFLFPYFAFQRRLRLRWALSSYYSPDLCATGSLGVSYFI